jgi:hypothetical protein
MWNVKSVKPYLIQDTLIKSVVHLIANGRQGQSLLGSIKTPKAVKKVLKGGIKAKQGLYLMEGIDVNQNQKSWQLLGLKGIKNEIQRKEKHGIESMAIEEGESMLDYTIEKQLEKSLSYLETSACVVAALNALRQTTSFLYQKAERIMLTTYSHFVSGVMLQKGIGYEL